MLHKDRQNRRYQGSRASLRQRKAVELTSNGNAIITIVWKGDALMPETQLRTLGE